MARVKSHLSVRLTPSLRARLEAAAVASHRTLSQQVVYMLMAQLREMEMRREAAGGELFR